MRDARRPEPTNCDAARGEAMQTDQSNDVRASCVPSPTITTKYCRKTRFRLIFHITVAYG